MNGGLADMYRFRWSQSKKVNRMDATPATTGRRATATLGDGGGATYVLRFSAQKSEVDLAKQFLAKGGTLGGAAARGNTSLALSHSDAHATFLLTDTNQTIDLPVPSKLLNTSLATFHAETNGRMQIGNNVGPHVLLSDRTRLNVVSTRTAAAINGTLVSTLAGTASVKLLDLFSTVDATKVVAGESVTGKAPRPNVAFTQIPIRYPNWESINATLGVCAPQIIRVGKDGTETEVSAIFFTPTAQAERLAKVQPVIKSIYDRAWQMTKDAVFAPEPNLHKSVVAERDAGFDMSGYSLAAAANDTPAPVLPEVAEAVLAATLAQELPHTHTQMLADLAVPSLKATGKYSQAIATGLSATAAWAMTYRVDGTPADTPEGLKMFQSESWPVQANVDFGRLADDCDGQASLANQFIAQAWDLKTSGTDMSAYPNLRAVANSIGAHYVHGMTVLAANAGHADAADASKKSIAGHAIITALPKVSFGMAMARGARAKINGKYVVDPQFQRAVATAQWEELYPEWLLDEMPSDERRMLASHDVARQMHVASMATGPQPLAIEGTTFASSQLYEHDEAKREERKIDFIDAKRSLDAFSPNILRVFKTLDVCETGEHAFYNAMVEQSFSLKHGLMTSGPLRSMNAACCHVRHVQVSPAGDVVGTGSSPKDLATGNFALVPLWTAGTEDGALIDEAHAEALSNTLPMRGTPISANSEIFHANMKTLRDLDAFFHEEGKSEYDGFPHQAIVSFASLVGNAHALSDLSEVMKATPNLRGEIYGLDTAIKGLATDASGEELGRYIVIEVELPRK
tara:strand:- start:3111 stop:5513 length:2403 start_codon:yes stop_codon:yes gene_type:complete